MEHDAIKLQMWAAEHCALSDVFVGGRGTIILVGLKDRPRPAASFARTIRTALNGMEIPTSCLKGHWVTLITEEEALRLCNSKNTDMSVVPEGGCREDRHRESSDSESKTVVLPVRC